MFNTSNNSSERSMRNGLSEQRPKSVTSGRSTPSSRHSDNRNRPPLKIPGWVHCEKCHCPFSNNLILLTCLHIFCRSCFNINDAVLTNERVPCPVCKANAGFRPIDNSLKASLHGLFEENWTDPVLKINLRNLQFMMTKTQNYVEFLGKNAKENKVLEPEWVERYNATKKFIERVKNKPKMGNEVATKTNLIKAEASKKYKNVQRLRPLYQRKQFQSRQRQHQQKHGHQQKNLKFVSSGRNEQSNQYIGQVKSSHYQTNQNQRAVNSRNFNQRATTYTNTTSQRANQFHENSSMQNAEIGSVHSSIRSATFRPNTKDINSGYNRYESQHHAQKRLVTSFDYDEYTNSSKRSTNHPIRNEINLDTSGSSIGSLDDPSSLLINRPTSGLRDPLYN